jgi:hypothetical protein
MAQMQVAAVQQLFLRSEENRRQTGLDFFDEDDREILLNIVIDTIAGGVK